ncbi:restriction endonuclease subunit S [Muricauda sp. MAR_2010_75]|uniref:restriction endonuclease subunit S n=1 Tax=Allomuricauda sp. MAR_2010_75 TaxID=1250232 RepID=UPI0018CCBEBA|nr:restriction endonuclease subunit S [Muricauda sp. MAR_2010_75]
MAKHKKSKLGHMPKGWTTQSINDVFDFLTTTSYSRNQLNYEEDNKVFYIHYGDIHATYNEPILDFKSIDEIPRLNNDIVLPKNIQYLKNGDVVIADASEDYEGIGTAIELVNLEDNKAISGLHTFALRDKKGLTAIGFRAYIFKNPNVKKQLKVIATGSKVYGISKTNIQKFNIVLPPLPEQQKIAKILATWDKAIAKQEALISQKQKLKKGLMQQLLTGKKRFKGFDGEWDKFKLGELTEIYDGTHSTPKYVARGIPFYSVENVSNDDFQKTKYISESVFEKENERVVLEKGDILMTRIGDIGTPKLLNWDVRASFYVSLSLIKKSKRIKPEFLEQFIQSTFFQKELFKRTIHVAFPKKINLGEIGHCHIHLPSQEEQNKIASVLSSADQEITLLKEHLKNLEKQKQGLMQKLLTGEIRVKV